MFGAERVIAKNFSLQRKCPQLCFKTKNAFSLLNSMPTKWFAYSELVQNLIFAQVKVGNWSLNNPVTDTFSFLIFCHVFKRLSEVKMFSKSRREQGIVFINVISKHLNYNQSSIFRLISLFPSLKKRASHPAFV